MENKHMSKAQIVIAALRELDPQNDNQWTSDGQPRIDAVKWLAKDQSITREDITSTAPGFSRQNLSIPLDPGTIAQTVHSEEPQGTGDKGTGGGEIAAPAAVQGRAGTVPSGGDSELLKAYRKAHKHEVQCLVNYEKALKELDSARNVADEALREYEKTIPVRAESLVIREYLAAQSRKR